jgi:hypothetical protein
VVLVVLVVSRRASDQTPTWVCLSPQGRTAFSSDLPPPESPLIPTRLQGKHRQIERDDLQVHSVERRPIRECPREQDGLRILVLDAPSREPEVPGRAKVPMYTHAILYGFPFPFGSRRTGAEAAASSGTLDAFCAVLTCLLQDFGSVNHLHIRNGRATDLPHHDARLTSGVAPSPAARTPGPRPCRNHGLGHLTVLSI